MDREFNLEDEITKIDESIAKLKHAIEIAKATTKLLSSEGYVKVIEQSILERLVESATYELVNKRLGSETEQDRLDELRFVRDLREYTKQLIVAGELAKTNLAKEEVYRESILNNQ